jgi:hypothetical protein
MSLLFFDGFDHYGNGVDPVSYGKWGADINTPSNTTTTQKRTGTYSYNPFRDSYGMVTKALPVTGGFIVGMALFPVSITGNTVVISIREGAIIHVSLGITAGGILQVYNGSGTVIATGTTVIPIGGFTYIEFKGTISDTIGTYTVNINGVVEAALNGSGADTRNGGTGVWDRVGIQGVSSANFSTYIDDFYICDMSGSAPTNDFLGLVKVELLMPQTDAVSAGSNAGLTPSTGTDHGALVDEIGPNTTDYNSGSTVGLKDTYQYPSATLTGTIYGIQTNLYAMKTDASVRAVCAVVRTNSVDYDGANVSPLTTFSYFSEVRALNPNTGIAWTTAEINAIQVGMKVTV